MSAAVRLVLDILSYAGLLSAECGGKNFSKGKIRVPCQKVFARYRISKMWEVL